MDGRTDSFSMSNIFTCVFKYERMYGKITDKTCIRVNVCFFDYRLVTDLLAVFSDVSNTVATVAKILILLALARKVAVLVALEALFTSSSKTAVPVSASAAIASCASRTALRAFPREVAHSAAFVARARTHVFYYLESANKFLKIIHITNHSILPSHRYAFLNSPVATRNRYYVTDIRKSRTY